MRKLILILIISISIISIKIFDGHLFLLDLVPRNLNNIIDLNRNYSLISKDIYGGNLFNFLLISQGIILVILFLSGYFMYGLMKYLINSKYAGLYAGLLYAFNPFTYLRTLTGQWIILFSYSLLPLLILKFIKLISSNERNNKEEIEFVFILTLISFSSHILIISLLILVLIIIYFRNSIKLKYSILSIEYILLNFYWLLPAILTPPIINNMGVEDFKVFSPNIGLHGLFDLAAMYGFWRDGYVYAKDFIPAWYILYLIILFLAIIGFIFNKNSKITNLFVIIGLLGFILATGKNGHLNLIYLLFDNDLIKGFRDSHKFVTMMSLSYSILGGFGIFQFEKLIPYKNKNLIIIFIFIPIIYSFTFFNGFGGQIKLTNYPNDWYEMNNFLNEDKQDFKVLFFPWHQYMDFKWLNNTQKRMVNPAPNFFDKPVLIASNIEIGNIYREDNYPDQIYIDNLLLNRNQNDFGEKISLLNIKYILLTKEADYYEYKFLFNQSDLELIKETQNFFLFKTSNKVKVAKIYQTDDPNNISQKIDLNYKEINNFDFKMEKPSKKYIIFTEPYSKDWKLYDKGKIILSKIGYGVVNSFENQLGNNNNGDNNGYNNEENNEINNEYEIRFEKFYNIILNANLISLITFIILISYYMKRKKRKL